MLLNLFYLGLLSALVLNLAASLGWPFEIVSHFRPHLWLLTFSALFWTIMVRQKVGSSIFASFLLVLTVQISTPSSFRPVTEFAGNGDEIKVVWANVLGSEISIKSTALQAVAYNADIISLGEIHSFSEAELERLFPAYPHIVETGDQYSKKHSTRIAILSKHPVTDVTVHRSEDKNRPWIEANIQIREQSILFLAAHPIPPGTPEYLRKRNAVLRAASDKLNQHPNSIWVGDFNITPWSPDFKELGVKRVGVPFFQSTWLTNWTIFGLPIDHVVVSENLRVSKYHVGRFIYSDHYPVFATIHLP